MIAIIGLFVIQPARVYFPVGPGRYPHIVSSFELPVSASHSQDKAYACKRHAVYI